MKAVSDGFNELTELKAIGRKRGEVTLTHTGRQLARIPIDVRLGRMVIEAAKPVRRIFWPRCSWSWRS